MNYLPEFIQSFLNSPWAVLSGIISFIYFLNYKALSSYAEKPESFAQAIEWLKQDKFGEFYFRLLASVLDTVSDWIGDKAQYKAHYKPKTDGGFLLSTYNRFFSVNPFTHQSYEAMLRLAFIYPILSFLVVWAMGSDGSIAGNTWLGSDLRQVPTELRWQILVIVVILPIIVLPWLVRQTLKTQLIILGSLSLFAVIFGFSQAIFVFWVLFTVFFFPCYGMGWITARLSRHNNLSAHQLIYPFAFTLGAAVAVAVAVAGAAAVVAAAAAAGGVFQDSFRLNFLSRFINSVRI